MRRKHGIGFIAVTLDIVEERAMISRLRRQGIHLPTDDELDATLARAGLRRGDGLEVQRKLAEKDIA